MACMKSIIFAKSVMGISISLKPQYQYWECTVVKRVMIIMMVFKSQYIYGSYMLS